VSSSTVGVYAVGVLASNFVCDHVDRLSKACSKGRPSHCTLTILRLTTLRLPTLRLTCSNPCLERTEEDFDPMPPEGCEVKDCPSHRNDLDPCFSFGSCGCWCQHYESATSACPHLHSKVRQGKGSKQGARNTNSKVLRDDGPGLVVRAASYMGLAGEPARS